MGLNDYIKEIEEENLLLPIFNAVQKKDNYYQRIIIPKKQGFRKLDSPSGIIRYSQEKIKKAFAESRYKEVEKYQIPSFGYEIKRSIKDNAKIHLNKRHIVNIDIQNFFHSISKEMVNGLIKKYLHDKNEEYSDLISEILTYKNRLPQGAPSSPIISNLVFVKFDRIINKICLKNDISYSRYSDDLTFSTNQVEFPFKILNKIKFILHKNGFRINNKKFRHLKKHQRQVVTGLVVNEKLNINRKEYKRIRAIVHNLSKYNFEKNKKTYESVYPGSDFIKSLEGKIEYLGNIFGKNDNRYLCLKDKYIDWKTKQNKRSYRIFRLTAPKKITYNNPFNGVNQLDVEYHEAIIFFDCNILKLKLIGNYLRGDKILEHFIYRSFFISSKKIDENIIKSYYLKSAKTWPWSHTYLNNEFKGSKFSNAIKVEELEVLPNNSKITDKNEKHLDWIYSQISS